MILADNKVAPVPDQATSSTEPPATDPPLARAPRAFDYDRGGGTVTVRGFRALVVLMLVNTILLASMALGPQIFPFARQQLQQWKNARAEKRRLQAELAAQQLCRVYAPAPTKVVYEEDPDKGANLLKASAADYESAMPYRSGAPPGWIAPLRAKAPGCFDDFLTAVHGAKAATRWDNLLFLHERASPSGQRFVVAVRLRAAAGFNARQGRDFPMTPTSGSSTSQVTFIVDKRRMVEADWWPVGTAGPSVDARGKGRNARLLLSLPDEENHVAARVKPGVTRAELPAIDYGNKLRFYAGQPDPNDPSRFTIAYEVDGRPGAIDGRLGNDTLNLQPREGSWTYGGNGQAWKLLTTEVNGDDGPVSPPTAAPTE